MFPTPIFAVSNFTTYFIKAHTFFMQICIQASALRQRSSQPEKSRFQVRFCYQSAVAYLGYGSHGSCHPKQNFFVIYPRPLYVFLVLSKRYHRVSRTWNCQGYQSCFMEEIFLTRPNMAKSRILSCFIKEISMHGPLLVMSMMCSLIYDSNILGSAIYG